MNCKKNKHTTLIREYRHLIGEQAETIKELQEKIKKLESSLESLKEASKLNDEFMNYHKFYVKDRKKYDTIINEVDRILTKYNC
jgi:chromosome segregation ATPase